MNNTSSKGKEIKTPGPDHPITISPAEGKVRVTVAGRLVAESTQALQLEEKGYPAVSYLPRRDADMSLLVRTTHYTYCPYKGDCTYYSIPIGGAKAEYAAWTYEKPYEAVADIKEYLAFYPLRVDAIEVIAYSDCSAPLPRSANRISNGGTRLLRNSPLDILTGWIAAEKRVFEVLKSYVGYPTRAIVEAMQALPTLFALGGNK